MICVKKGRTQNRRGSGCCDGVESSCDPRDEQDVCASSIEMKRFRFTTLFNNTTFESEEVEVYALTRTTYTQ
jgi:uncharacterized protein (DUF779 family)